MSTRGLDEGKGWKRAQVSVLDGLYLITVPDVAVPSDVGFFIGQLDTSDKNAPLYGSILMEFLRHIFINFTRERVKVNYYCSLKF